MRDQRKAEAIAQERVQLLAPLLAEGLDPAKTKQLKTQICIQAGISDRTLRRYLAQYRAGGFNALKPKGKGREPQGTIPENVMEQAILLRREVPSRSVAQIIQILEWEGLVRSEEHTSELQSRPHLVCRLLLEKKKIQYYSEHNNKQRYIT